MKLITKQNAYSRVHQVSATIRETMKEKPMHDWEYFDIEEDICERVENNLSILRSLSYQVIDKGTEFTTYRITKI